MSTKKALTGGALGANVAMVILHSLNTRQVFNMGQDKAYQLCPAIFGDCLVIEPKRLVTELVITNAIFITPKVWKAARSYFWPTKK